MLRASMRDAQTTLNTRRPCRRVVSPRRASTRNEAPRGSETGLVLVFGVWIAWVQRRVLLEKPHSRVVEGYQQPGVRVVVNIDAEIATGTCVARGIDRVLRKWALPILDGQPGL